MANKSSMKVIQSSMAEAQDEHNANIGLCDLVLTKNESKINASTSDQLSELQGCLLSSFNAASCSSTRNTKNILNGNDLGSPTLVPCNSPAITPAHSVTKALHQFDATTDFFKEASAGTECLSTEHSSFNISLVSDNSEEDDELPSLASLDKFFSAPPEHLQRLPVSSSYGIGLGISGISRKDGSGPFDGLGIVSIGSSPWHNSSCGGQEDPTDSFGRISGCPSSSTQEGYDAEEFPLMRGDSTDSLSSTFLQETLLTFTEDPFHGHALNSIPECQSWYELNEVSRRGSPITSELSVKYEARCRGASPARTRGNFLSATISSELKRSLTGPVKKSDAPPRARSATWPTRATGAADGGRGAVGGHGLAWGSNTSKKTWRV